MQNFLFIKTFENFIILLEAYPEPCQTYKMVLFTKTVNCVQLLTIFAKKHHLRCLTCF